MTLEPGCACMYVRAYDESGLIYGLTDMHGYVCVLRLNEGVMRGYEFVLMRVRVRVQRPACMCVIVCVIVFVCSCVCVCVCVCV